MYVPIVLGRTHKKLVIGCPRRRGSPRLEDSAGEGTLSFCLSFIMSVSVSQTVVKH